TSGTRSPGFCDCVMRRLKRLRKNPAYLAVKGRTLRCAVIDPLFLSSRTDFSRWGICFSDFFRSLSKPALPVLGMAGHAHHRRTQQPVLQLVAALQLLEHLVVLDLVGVHHLDRL